MISVLLVDDEAALLELAKFFLDKNDDLSNAVASSAREALSLMEGAEFDAIVCDYQMPEMDGLELLKLLRAQKNDIPFVLFTGRGREDVAIEALNSGADFYLQKGGDPNSQFAELANMIRSSVAALRSKRELARNEERFRLLAENSEVMVYRFAVLPSQRFEYVSPACERIFGWTPEEHYANPALATEVVHREDRHYMEELATGTLDLSGPLRVRGVRKDGGTVWVELRLVPFRDGEGRLTAIEGTVVDIDKAVKAEEELRRSEAHYRLVFETAGSAMVIIDEEGVMQSVNSAYERLSGYSRAEIEGKARWTSFLDPGYASTLIQEYAESARDPAAASKGHPFRIKDKFGRELALVAYTAVIPGTGKTVVSMVDETERVRYEEAMQQAGKKMDLLAKITRHDVMNQLAALFGYLELVQEREADPDTRALLAKARTASESIRRHIEFARDYQSMGRKRPQWVDVLSACRRAASNIELRGVRVVTELEGLEVFADPMLEKVFYNLVDNSLKHGVRTTTVTFSYIHGPEGMRLVYEDDGAGVPDQEKAAIFERTAADRDGPRGYGLYLAREILAMTGITISETGRFGEGARFEMLVPKGRYRTKMGPERPGHGRRGRAL